MKPDLKKTYGDYSIEIQPTSNGDGCIITIGKLSTKEALVILNPETILISMKKTSTIGGVIDYQWRQEEFSQQQA